MISPKLEVKEHTPSDILIIEDERDTASLYQSHLQDEYSTTLATSGEQALELLSPAVDLILLDLNLPRMNGEDVIEAIENGEVEHSDPAIAVLTARKPTSEVLEYPVDKYKIKPVYQDELHTLINDIALQNKFQHLSTTLFQKRSKRNALDQAGETDTEVYRQLLDSIEELESQLRDVYDQIVEED